MDFGAIQFEFHANQDTAQHPGATCINHCLLRVWDRSYIRAATEALTAIGDAFTGFAYLQTMVLETSHELDTDDVQSLTKALRKALGVAIQHRTSEEAHKLALRAKKSYSLSASEGLLSPFWCLQEHVKEWDQWWVFIAHI